MLEQNVWKARPSQHRSILEMLWGDQLRLGTRRWAVSLGTSHSGVGQGWVALGSAHPAHGVESVKAEEISKMCVPKTIFEI